MHENDLLNLRETGLAWMWCPCRTSVGPRRKGPALQVSRDRRACPSAEFCVAATDVHRWATKLRARRRWVKAVIANQPLLDGRCYQDASLGEESPGGESSSATARWRMHVIENPFVETKGSMKPDGVIKTGDLHMWLQPGLTMRVQGRA